LPKVGKELDLIAGINLFADYESKSKHKRGSVGLEYQRANFNLNVNKYFPRKLSSVIIKWGQWLKGSQAVIWVFRGDFTNRNLCFALAERIGIFIGFLVNATFDIADGLVFNKLLKQVGTTIGGAIGSTNSDNASQLGNKITTGIKSQLKNQAISNVESRRW
jgi:hypothetical protein